MCANGVVKAKKPPCGMPKQQTERKQQWLDKDQERRAGTNARKRRKKVHLHRSQPKPWMALRLLHPR